MELAAGERLILLWLVPVIIWLRVRADVRRDRARRALLGDVLGPRLAPVPSIGRRWLGRILVGAGVAALIVALARPRFGIYYEDASARGVDIFVLIDTSRSMLAEDVRPNRLARAIADTRDLLARVAGDRVGLIAFAGAAVVKCPLTLDQRFFELALADLDIASAPRGGTAIGDAIRKALASFGEEASERARLIVIFTDGGDQESYPREAAAQAAERGVRIIAIGLGDPSGGTPVPGEGGGFMTHAGETVRSQLDLDTLRAITTASGGVLIPAGLQHYDLGQVYDDHIARLIDREANGEKRARRHERFQWFAMLALVLLIGDTLLSPLVAAPSTRATP